MAMPRVVIAQTMRDDGGWSTLEPQRGTRVMVVDTKHGYADIHRNITQASARRLAQVLRRWPASTDLVDDTTVFVEPANR